MFTGSDISSGEPGPGVPRYETEPPVIADTQSGPGEGAPFVIGHWSLEARPSQFKRAVLLTAAVLAATVIALFYLLIDPVRVSIFPPCLFHQLTGLDCPGCGAQRAFHQLLHGHLITAIRLNAMFVFSIPLFAWMGSRFVVRNFRGEPATFQFGWCWAYIAAWILFGVLRNLPFTVCQWFAA